VDLASIRALRHGITDRQTVRRYWKLVWPQPVLRDDQIWIGAISAGGHGRFWIRDIQGKDIAISSHRFRWALEHGVDSLLADQAIFSRRDLPGSPLRDVRGPRGRAVALRTALLQGEDINQVARQGEPPMDRCQATLFD